MEPKRYPDFSGGQANNINPSLTPDSVCDLMMNLEADVEIGSAVSRLGTALVGTQTVDNKTILGVVQHVDQADTTKNKLFAAVNDSSNTNSDIFDVGSGISLADDTASLKCRFLNYNGDTLRLNGTDAPKAYNSSTWITTGGVFDLANMPTGYKYPAEFLSRAYLWGKASSPYTLAYSGILTAGAVSWTSGNGTIEIEPEDNGGEGTGLGKVPGYLLIFKRRAMHRWNFSSAFPEQLVNIGAYSQESIINAGGLCAFYSDSNENEKGFYITDGNRPICISEATNRPIKKWVDAISSTAIVAGFGTNNYLVWSVGDLTVDGETWTNVVLKYNRILNQWTVRSYPTGFRVFASYVTGGIHTIVGGDDDGNVIRVDKAGTYTDHPSTTPIRYRLRTKHDTFNANTKKRVSDRGVVRGENLAGIRLNAIPNRDVSKAIPLQAPTPLSKILSLFGIGSNIDATTISTEVIGETTGNRAIIQEIELGKVETLATYE